MRLACAALLLFATAFAVANSNLEFLHLLPSPQLTPLNLLPLSGGEHKKGSALSVPLPLCCGRGTVRVTANGLAEPANTTLLGVASAMKVIVRQVFRREQSSRLNGSMTGVPPIRCCTCERS